MVWGGGSIFKQKYYRRSRGGVWNSRWLRWWMLLDPERKHYNSLSRQLDMIWHLPRCVISLWLIYMSQRFVSLVGIQREDQQIPVFYHVLAWGDVVSGRWGRLHQPHVVARQAAHVSYHRPYYSLKPDSYSTEKRDESTFI